MRLLHTRKWKIEEFHTEDDLPRYAILSHRWDEVEISFQQFRAIHRSPDPARPGMSKIRRCCEYAQHRGFSWVWIDSCCIDKSNSAELSEAINSMWRYYQHATECLVYLSDVDPIHQPARKGRLTDHDFAILERSSWFTRGWTLQELLAPRKVIFLDARWRSFGTKHDLALDLESITGIYARYIDGTKAVSDASIATRMSWASQRCTTKHEDLAYCLLGIFDVNMPLLYGEGPKAFMRLQLEIMRKSSDESLFAWWDDLDSSGLLAKSPKAFIDSGRISNFDRDEYDKLPYCMTNRGLELHVPVEEKSDRPPDVSDPFSVLNGAARRQGVSLTSGGLGLPHNGYEPVSYQRRVSYPALHGAYTS